MKKILSLIVIYIFFSSIAFSAHAATSTSITMISFEEINFGESDGLLGALYNGTYDGTNGINGKYVRIYRHYAGQSWQYISRPTTATLEGLGNGLFIVYNRPSRNVIYQARFLGDGSYDASNSRSIRTIVRVQISATGRKYGSYYKLSGQVRPSKAGRIVYIKMKRKGGSWRTAARKRLNSRSRYSYKYNYGRSGTYYIRVYYPGDVNNGSKYSSTKRFTVN